MSVDNHRGISLLSCLSKLFSSVFSSVLNGSIEKSSFLEDLELFLQNDINLGILIDNITIKILLFADDMVILGGKQPIGYNVN